MSCSSWCDCCINGSCRYGSSCPSYTNSPTSASSAGSIIYSIVSLLCLCCCCGVAWYWWRRRQNQQMLMMQQGPPQMMMMSYPQQNPYQQQPYMGAPVGYQGGGYQPYQPPPPQPMNLPTATALCPSDGACTMVNDPTHQLQFVHSCAFPKPCPYQSDPHHSKNFRH